jgi:maltooligosyltrehalose trehalohydrolase
VSAPLPALGAHVIGSETRFAVLSDARDCALCIFDAQGRIRAEHALEPLGGGYFEARVADAPHGTRYAFVLDGRELPDPYARFLPEGVHAPAMVYVSSYAFRHEPIARSLSDHVIYELHVGTFTEQGTYAAAAERLEALVELGVTTLELMPLAAFAGARGWGYDGVAHYAPFAPYGEPDELRAFVDRAHSLGLSVLLDVVYNHFGPSGNYLPAYSQRYFTSEFPTAWGDAPRFADAAMRRYVLENARYWLTEFRFDGLRLDATHALVDPSPKHLLRELAESVAELEPKRLLVAEDERNEPSLVTDRGLDAVWADDFHHQVRVTLTRERDGYYGAYRPGAAGVARTITRGWLYEGQPAPTSGKPRGQNADALTAEAFVYCIQNHDQVGNRALGDRLNHVVSCDAYLAASLLLLLLPMTPLLFMGQEWAASSPFCYFTDHEPELGALVTEGRRREFARFDAFADEAKRESIPDPQAMTTFERSRLDWQERDRGEHARVLALYRAALALRKSDPVLSVPSRSQMRAEAHDQVLVVTRVHDAQLRLIAVNFSERAVAADQVPPLAELTGATLLLASDASASIALLPPLSALVLSGSPREGSHS